MKPVTKFLSLIGIIAGAEVIIMVFLPLLGVPAGFWEGIADALLLVVVVAPFMYRFVMAEEALSERARHAALSADVGVALTKGLTLRTALQGCAEAMVKHLDAAFARIWTLNERDNILELRASAGMYTHIDGAHGRVPVGKYKIGLIAQEKIPHLTNSVIGDPRVHDQEWAKREGMVAFAGYPLIVENRVVGVAAMFARKPLSESTLLALGSVADEIAIGIERKRMEEALQESASRFRSLVEESQVGAFIVQEGRLVYFNKWFSGMFGYSIDELDNLTGFLDLVHQDDRGLVHDAVQRCFNEKAGCGPFQFRGLKKDKNTVNIEALGWITEYNGQAAVIGTLLDITERKQAEEEKSALFSMLTHDIRGPLTIINGYAELLSEKPPDSDTAAMASEINKASDRISLLIDDMLELSRIESGVASNREPVSIAELMRQVMSENGILADEMGLTISFVEEGSMPMVHADRRQLGRAFDNLISNAINYNRRGGKVTVRAGALADGIFVEVADTGQGIAEEDLPHIFDRYYRAKKVSLRKGTGLGLPIVKAVAEAHGGNVSATSREGEGSTFTFVLPVKP